jgi:hypothetical protein
MMMKTNDIVYGITYDIMLHFVYDIICIHDIVYEMQHDIVHDVAYDIVYDIVYDIFDKSSFAHIGTGLTSGLATLQVAAPCQEQLCAKHSSLAHQTGSGQADSGNQDSMPRGLEVRTASPRNPVAQRCPKLDPDRHHCFQEHNEEQDLPCSIWSEDIQHTIRYIVYDIAYYIVYDIIYNIVYDI